MNTKILLLMCILGCCVLCGMIVYDSCYVRKMSRDRSLSTTPIFSIPYTTSGIVMVVEMTSTCSDSYELWWLFLLLVCGVIFTSRGGVTSQWTSIDHQRRMNETVPNRWDPEKHPLQPAGFNTGGLLQRWENIKHPSSRKKMVRRSACFL